MDEFRSEACRREIAPGLPLGVGRKGSGLRLLSSTVSFEGAGTKAPGRENLDLVSLPNASPASGRVAAAHVQAARG
jgi:hypothetical protein